MRSQINLGRVFGIKIGLHYSWFIIALLIVFLACPPNFTLAIPSGAMASFWRLRYATAILFFVSLLLHELAHSLVAKSPGTAGSRDHTCSLSAAFRRSRKTHQREDRILDGVRGTLDQRCIGLLCLAVARIRSASSSPAQRWSLGSATSIWLWPALT